MFESKEILLLGYKTSRHTVKDSNLLNGWLWTDIQSQTDVPRNQPLFESVVIFENYPVESNHLPDDAKLSIAHVNVDEKTHYPFALFASGGEEIELCLHFQLNRCDKHDVECMIDFLNSILTRLANLGDLPVEDSSSLFPALRRPTEFEGPTTITSQLECAHQSFTRAARIHGDKSAIECGEQILTYQELDQQSSKLAVALQNDFKVGQGGYWHSSSTLTRNGHRHACDFKSWLPFCAAGSQPPKRPTHRHRKGW